MEWLRRLARRLSMLARRDAMERVMDDELRHHLDCEAAEWVRRGLTPAAARRRARHDFGGVERIKEEVRDARGVRPVEDLALDLRERTFERLVCPLDEPESKQHIPVS